MNDKGGVLIPEMTPYWPSPLGATRRRLAPRTGVEQFLFASDPRRVASEAHRRFPKANASVRWIAEADLPTPGDFDFNSDSPSRGAN